MEELRTPLHVVQAVRPSGPVVAKQRDFQPGRWRSLRKSDERHWSSWDAVVEAFPDVEAWAAPKVDYSTVWFDARHVPTEKLRWADRKPVAFVVGRPCEQMVHEGGRSVRVWVCGRPVPAGETMCGRHRAGARRRAATDARVHAEVRAIFEKADRAKANSQAATDWAERLRREFGLETRPRGTAERIEVGVNPETLYGVLDEVVGLLRDLGVADHPLSGRTGQD